MPKRKEYLLARIDAIEKLMAVNDVRDNERFAAIKEAHASTASQAERAVNKAQESIEERLKSTNEWRAAMSDKDRLFMPRSEMERMFDTVKEDIRDMKTSAVHASGMAAGRDRLIGVIIGVTGVLFAIYTAWKK